MKTRWKYLHRDGKGKVCQGLSEAQLSKRPWCSKIFGPLERPLGQSEQISATDGSIQARPPAAWETAGATRRAEIRALLTKLEAGTATAKEVQTALARVIRHVAGN